MSSPRKIPLLDLSGEVEALWDELREALEGVLRSGRFIRGPNVEALEREIAEYLGVRHAVGLNSGTDALAIGLRALGVEPGDEVITTPFTFVATAEAIRHVGAVPVFTDIDPDTFNLDPAKIERHITPRTRVLLPVHLFGQAADMDAILEIAQTHGLGVLEDAAQAFGAGYRGRKVGSLAHAATLSFYPTKNLGAYGDGGMLVTDQDPVRDVARELRNHGALDKYRTERLGYNSRLDEFQAAILRIKLPHVDQWNETRRQIARRYTERLGNLGGVVTPRESKSAHHVYHQYTIRLEEASRDAIHDKLALEGIATALYYPLPLHRLGPYRVERALLPEAERACGQVLSLPIGPSLEEDSITRVSTELERLLGS